MVNLIEALVPFLSLIVWILLFLTAKRQALWYLTPVSLFAFGILVFYMVPGTYWSFREWTYGIPDYQDGIVKVQCIALVLGMPLLFQQYFLQRQRSFLALSPIQVKQIRFANWAVVLFLNLALLGFLWRIYLFSYGFQGRFERDAPTVLGSEDLGFLVGNIGYYSRIFYFTVILVGSRFQRRCAYAAWIFDAFLQVVTLHRYSILMLIFNSFIFLAFRGFTFTLRRSLVIVAAVLFTLTIVGFSAYLAPDFRSNNSNYIKPLAILSLLSASATSYLGGNFDRNSLQSDAGMSFVRILDDTMFRLHEGRSAAAVVPHYPNTYPFLNGETIIPVVYALVPRFFWPGKPELRDTHVLTTDFMPGDAGVNPLGTLAELYINGGYILVVAAGLFCIMVFGKLLRKLQTNLILDKIALCVTYPFVAEILVSASKNVSQRLSEGMRMIVVYYFVLVILRMGRRRNDNNFNETSK